MAALGQLGMIAAALLTALCGCAPGARPPSPAKLVLTVRHADIPSFKEAHAMAIGEEVPIHDTVYSVRLIDFVPDFCMSIETREVYSRSPELKNPGVKIEMLESGRPLYTKWVLSGGGGGHRVRAPGYYFTISDVRLTGEAPPSPGSGPEGVEAREP